MAVTHHPEHAGDGLRVGSRRSDLKSVQLGVFNRRPVGAPWRDSPASDALQGPRLCAARCDALNGSARAPRPANPGMIGLFLAVKSSCSGSARNRILPQRMIRDLRLTMDAAHAAEEPFPFRQGVFHG